MVGFDEDDLYANLDWLADHQADIERRLFAHREAASAPDVFLYDVTSTYLEGEHNALAAFGYNRDRKSGKATAASAPFRAAAARPWWPTTSSPARRAARTRCKTRSLCRLHDNRFREGPTGRRCERAEG
jgi:hypothetical protein